MSLHFYLLQFVEPFVPRPLRLFCAKSCNGVLIVRLWILLFFMELGESVSKIFHMGKTMRPGKSLWIMDIAAAKLRWQRNGKEKKSCLKGIQRVVISKLQLSCNAVYQVISSSYKGLTKPYCSSPHPSLTVLLVCVRLKNWVPAIFWATAICNY